MVNDYFLKIDGIEGESQDDKHKNEVDILSFSWGVSQEGFRTPAGGTAASKAAFTDLTISKRVDKSSPLLFMACATGKHISKAVLTLRKAGKEQQEYLKYTLSDVLVSSYQTGGSGEDPVDQLSLNFTKISIQYVQQLPDGSAGGETEAGWDVKQNRGV